MKPTIEHKHRIVVGEDLSEASGPALGRALELAGRYEEAEVHLVTVIDSMGRRWAHLDEDERIAALAETRRSLAGFAGNRVLSEDLPDKGRKVPVILHLRVGAPADQIVCLARDLEADMIVVGTHGRRGIARALMGSVAQEVVRYAGCPVLVARVANA